MIHIGSVLDRTDHAPRLIHGVMLSSTFTDLREHRAALIQALRGEGLAEVAMENDSAKLADVIESSLQMVRDSSAFIGVISRKYGQTPVSTRRNPQNLSIAELEFHEALRLDRPILLFVMGERHPQPESGFEFDPAKREKLNAFREHAKQMHPDDPVPRVYAAFDSTEEFKEKAIHAVAGLRRYLDALEAKPLAHLPVALPSQTSDCIPKPPKFYAEPSYLGSHRFIGRHSQVETLDDWARSADTHPVLLFDAIGGTGKSMLTWEWSTKRAMSVRSDWAGRFWYSFYERGAMMADFCRRALAYMTGEPLDKFQKMKTPELRERLVHQLQARTWLLVLDGLERVLVAYQRLDAAQMVDEDVNHPTDQIADRDPCSAIRPEDDDLLRMLAACVPSKLLITSRLVPRVLLNQASQAIPGVLRVSLPGLRPVEAEELLISCGVRGESHAIQAYLKNNCDCHPLVTGALAGLINDYFPDRGNFDTWAGDAAGGGWLNLGGLDLVQKRNHILQASIDALPAKSRELLSVMALISAAVDYDTIKALNRQPLPERGIRVKPAAPEKSWRWKWTWGAKREEARRRYRASLERWNEYQRAAEGGIALKENCVGPEELPAALRDLERRGLVQYDANSRRFDLHPVVRAVAASQLRREESAAYGRRVVDYFSSRAHDPFRQAQTVDEVRDGIHVVSTLLRMGRYQEAFYDYRGALSDALLFNVEAYSDVLTLLRPFFPRGWHFLPEALSEVDGSYLANGAGIALSGIGESGHALGAYSAALKSDLRLGFWEDLRTCLANIHTELRGRGALARADRISRMELDLVDALEPDLVEGIDNKHRTAEMLNSHTKRFLAAGLDRFGLLSLLGRWDEAAALWARLNLAPPSFRSQATARAHAYYAFWRAELTQDELTSVEELTKTGTTRSAIRDLHCLRGEWHLARREWDQAAESLREAVAMARSIQQTDPEAETLLTLARFYLGDLSNPRGEAERLSTAKRVYQLALAELWAAIGDRKEAEKWTLKAYESAWADGEPYVDRYHLDRARTLLESLGVAIPNLRPYDPANDKKFPWEDDVVAEVQHLRQSRQSIRCDAR